MFHSSTESFKDHWANIFNFEMNDNENSMTIKNNYCAHKFFDCELKNIQQSSQSDEFRIYKIPELSKTRYEFIYMFTVQGLLAFLCWESRFHPLAVSPAGLHRKLRWLPQNKLNKLCVFNFDSFNYAASYQLKNLTPLNRYPSSSKSAMKKTH